MTRSLNEALLASGYTPELELMPRKILSLKEQGKKYSLDLNPGHQSTAFTIDGVILKSGIRCDKLVLIESSCSYPNWVEIFVELKGTHVIRAIDQLRETVKNPLFNHPSNRKNIRARVVAVAFPSNRSHPEIEKAKDEFKSRYSCELKIMKSGVVDKF